MESKMLEELQGLIADLNKAEILSLTSKMELSFRGSQPCE